MAQPPSKIAKLEMSSGLGTSSEISEDMDVTTENGSIEVQGAGVRALEGNEQSDFDDVEKRCLIESEEFEQLLLSSSAFIDKTLFIKSFFWGSLNEKSVARKILITAPSRFGKSVMMKTLKAFCEPDVDEEGNIVTCLIKNAAGKWIEDKNKTPPKNYEIFKTLIRNKPLKIYSCNCLTQHTGDDLENGKCNSRQFFYVHCGQHPVIFLSLKNIMCDNWDQFIEGLKDSLCNTYKKHMYLGDEKRSRLSEHMKVDFNLFCEGNKCKMEKNQNITSKLDESDLLSALKKLVEYLYIQFGRKVLILIDEFDAPLMQLVHSEEKIDEEYIEKIIQYIGMMVGSVVKGNEMVLGALINACVSLATTVLPYANNLSVCRFLEDHKFSEYYGFTNDEVADLLKTHLFKSFNEADVLLYYNGYKVFGRNLALYNTFSVLKYLHDWDVAWQREKREANNKKNPDKKKHKPRHYFSNHGISLLDELFAIEGIRKNLSDVITNNSIAIGNPMSKMRPKDVLTLKEVISQPAKVEDEHADLFIQYMKDRGYFNISEMRVNLHFYDLPNGEVKDEIISQFYRTSYYKRKYNISNEVIDKYKRAITDLGCDNNKSFQKFADSIASLFSGDFKPMNHQDEIKGVLYAFAKHEFDVSFEPLCKKGRKHQCDLLLIREDGTGIIIEVKYGDKTAQSGLKQIFDDEYYKAFDLYNITRDKIHIGLHMNDKEVTICAFATSNEKVEKFEDIKKEDLIVKSSKLS